MLIYIFCYLASLFFAYLAQRSRNKGTIILLSVISIMIPCILGGLRARTIGTDTRGYAYPNALKALHVQNFWNYFDSLPDKEPGYKLLCWVIMKIFGHPNYTLFSYQLITVSCIYIGAYRFRKIAYVPFTMLIFYLVYYQQSYNTMRQIIAASIVFAGLRDVIDRRYLRFMLYLIIAATFHYSALVCAVSAAFMHYALDSEFLAKHSTLKSAIALSIIGSVIFFKPLASFAFSYLPFMSEKYSIFLDITAEENARKYMIGIFSGPIIMFCLYARGARRLYTHALNANRNSSVSRIADGGGGMSSSGVMQCFA